jgi:hypothetical protein
MKQEKGTVQQNELPEGQIILVHINLDENCTLQHCIS